VRPLDHDGAGAAPGGIGEEIVAVVRLAAYRDEELSRVKPPGVGRHAGEIGARPEPHELAPGRGEDLLQPEGGVTRLDRRAHPCLPRALCTSSRSSRWRFSVPTI
jgi:hypothetical protein